MSKLDRVSTVSGVLAAISLGSIGAIITAQIVARGFGHQIPASDDFATWAMVVSIFLALPYAMLHGDHIRITVLLQLLPPRARRIYELQATAISAAIAAWATYYTGIFVYESFTYGEVSQGMLKVPLWIPQVAIPIGMALLTAVLVQRFVRCLRGDILEESNE